MTLFALTLRDTALMVVRILLALAMMFVVAMWVLLTLMRFGVLR